MDSPQSRVRESGLEADTECAARDIVVLRRVNPELYQDCRLRWRSGPTYVLAMLVKKLMRWHFFVAVSNRNYLVSERWQLAVSSVWITSAGSGSAGLRQLATTQFGHVDRDALGNVMESSWCRAPSTGGTSFAQSPMTSVIAAGLTCRTSSTSLHFCIQLKRLQMRERPTRQDKMTH